MTLANICGAAISRANGAASGKPPSGKAQVAVEPQSVGLGGVADTTRLGWRTIVSTIAGTSLP